MKNLRPELVDSNAPAIPYSTALFLIRNSVAQRRSLIFGKLDDVITGEHCALGCFWEDNPKAILSSALINEVAAVNDSVPPSATPHERWKKVNSWLRWKLRVIANGGRDK